MSRLPSRLISAVPYLAALIALFFASAIFIQRTLESDFLEHWRLAVGFALIPAIAVFLVCLAIGSATHKLIEKRLRRRLQHPLAQPWAVPMIAAAVIVVIALFQDRSANTLFQERLGISVPSSMHDFRYWWGTLPGDAEFVAKFKIDSAEFHQLLAGRNFIQLVGTDALDDAARESAAVRGKRADLALPDHFQRPIDSNPIRQTNRTRLLSFTPR